MRPRCSERETLARRQQSAAEISPNRSANSCKHSFLVSASEIQTGVGVLWLRVDGETLTTCTRHRRCASVSFAKALCGCSRTVFNFQRQTEPVTCLFNHRPSALFWRLCYVRRRQRKCILWENVWLFSETDPLHGLIWMESFRLDTNPTSLLRSG